MIARQWTCLCPRERRAGFLRHLERTGVAETAALPGCLGHQVLEREEPGGVRICLITYWESMEAVRAYAGEEPEQARLYEGDEAFGIEPETRALHWRVLESRIPAP